MPSYYSMSSTGDIALLVLRQHVQRQNPFSLPRTVMTRAGDAMGIRLPCLECSPVRKLQHILLSCAIYSSTAGKASRAHHERLPVPHSWPFKLQHNFMLSLRHSIACSPGLPVVFSSVRPTSLLWSGCTRCTNGVCLASSGAILIMPIYSWPAFWVVLMRAGASPGRCLWGQLTEPAVAQRPARVGSSIPRRLPAVQ